MNIILFATLTTVMEIVRLGFHSLINNRTFTMNIFDFLFSDLHPPHGGGHKTLIVGTGVYLLSRQPQFSH
jgi:hypothetical protein